MEQKILESHYQITITRLSKVHVHTKSWKKIRDVPETIKNQSKFYNDDGDDKISEYGYVQIEEIDTESKVVYSQEMADQADIPKIILAINSPALLINSSPSE